MAAGMCDPRLPVSRLQYDTPPPLRRQTQGL